MSESYPHPPPGYGYGMQSQSGGGQPYSVAPPKTGCQHYYAAPPQGGGQPHYASPYGGGGQHGQQAPFGYSSAPPSQSPSQPYGAPSPYGAQPPTYHHHHDHNKPPMGYPTPNMTRGISGGGGGGYHSAMFVGAYASPFASLVPSAFPPGTDPNIVSCFQMADQDGSDFIDDKELQRALSSCNQSFSLRTVHLLMYHFTNSNVRKIGPKEFISLFYSLQNWRAIFEKFDMDMSGKIDKNELKEALYSLGYAVSLPVLDLLVSKFDKTGGMNKAVEYDNFIECCLTVKGLTEKFKEKDMVLCGSATFTYEAFMITVLPFLLA